MKILFVTPSYKPAYCYGGTVTAVAMLAESLAQEGHEIAVYSTTANGEGELDVPLGEDVDIAGVKVKYFNRNTGDHTHVSISLWRHLNRTVRNFDIVHIHSWWNFLVIGSVWVCRRRDVKPILSPHGMFSGYILNQQNRLKKKLIHGLLGKYLLRHTYLHVSSEMEWHESLRVNPEWSGRVIPNLVEFPPVLDRPADNFRAY